MMKQFEVGKRYMMRSACDHECVWKYEVIARTAKQVTLKAENGEEIKCRINDKIDPWNEVVFPLGRYSMAPLLRAERAMYEIKEKKIPTGETKYVIVGMYLGPGYFFAGYNFMGGVEWETDILVAYYMDIEEAQAILNDLNEMEG